MSDQFVGEVRMFAGDYAPKDWAICAGQLLPIRQHTALFELLGTTYGGDGRVTFALPDLRGRFPMHAGSRYGAGGPAPGETAGEERVTLTPAQLPAHTHVPQATSSAATTAAVPQGTWAVWPDSPYAGADAPTTAMNAAALSPAGGGASHENMPPFVTVTFIIALYGVFPQRP
jgi:microcystin-dependent protein